jgi:SAM-dependent methyltransferase
MANFDEFVNPKLRLHSLDTFIIRSAIFTAMKQVLSILSGTLVDVGCGQMPYRETIMSFGQVKNYIGLDLNHNDIYKNNPDLTWDGVTIPLDDSSVDCAMATELFEHCTEPEVVMKEIFRVLRPGGKMFFTVPFLWPLHDVPHDHYRYTPFSLNRHLTGCGFHKIIQSSLGGWDKCLAQMIGLYVRRRQMSPLLRFLISLIALPLV